MLRGLPPNQRVIVCDRDVAQAPCPYLTQETYGNGSAALAVSGGCQYLWVWSGCPTTRLSKAWHAEARVTCQSTSRNSRRIPSWHAIACELHEHSRSAIGSLTPALPRVPPSMPLSMSTFGYYTRTDCSPRLDCRISTYRHKNYLCSLGMPCELLKKRASQPSKACCSPFAIWRFYIFF